MTQILDNSLTLTETIYETLSVGGDIDPKLLDYVLTEVDHLLNEVSLILVG